MNMMEKLNIPEDFYLPEIRDGYEVSAESKKVWAVQLDLLYRLQQILQKHNLKYYACGGTMLGAVRHKGFIPWDDDIDIMMPREDYDRLCELAPGEFQDPYFFQVEKTDPGYLLRHAKLRNSNTAAMQEVLSSYRCMFNQGVFIDIFPLDKVPDDKSELETYYDLMWKLWGKVWRLHAYTYRRHRTTFLENLKCRLLELFRMGDRYNAEYEILAGKYKSSDCGRWEIHATSLTANRTERFMWEVSDFEDVTMMPFEMLELPVPKRYDAILKKSYGNWTEFVVGGSLHGEIKFDTENSYRKYLKHYDKDI